MDEKSKEKVITETYFKKLIEIASRPLKVKKMKPIVRQVSQSFKMKKVKTYKEYLEEDKKRKMINHA